MAKGFRFFDVERFPNLSIGQAYRVPSQLSLVLDMEVPDTSIELVDPNYYSSFARYRIHHEILERIHGRAKNVTFEEYVRPVDFPAYYHSEKGVLLMQGKKEVIIDCARVFSERSADVSINSRAVDLGKIKPLLTYVKGAWFNLEAAHLRAAGLFGDRVDQSEQYKQAEATGELSAIQVNYEYSGILFVVQITMDGAVILYQNIEPDVELDLLMDVKEKILDRG